MYRSRWALACALVAALVSGRVVAQEAAAPNKESADICDSERAVAQAARRIERILNQSLKTPLSFTQVPLSQVMDQLADEYDLPIVFDRAALEAAATSPDVEVTVELNNVSLRSALELMLRQLEDLTF